MQMRCKFPAKHPSTNWWDWGFRVFSEQQVGHAQRTSACTSPSQYFPSWWVSWSGQPLPEFDTWCSSCRFLCQQWQLQHRWQKWQRTPINVTQRPQESSWRLSWIHSVWTVNGEDAGRRCQPSHCWRQPLQVLSGGLSCGYWKTLSLGDSLNVTPHWSHFVELILRCQSGTSQRRWLVGLSCSACVDHGKAVVKCKKPWPEWSVFTSSN